MDTKNSRPDFVFIIPTLTNVEGLKHVLVLLKKIYPERPFIVMDNKLKNVGFAKACNDGARKAQKSFSPGYLVFLNDDVDFTSDWVNECIVTMRKNDWIASSPILMSSKKSIENAGYIVLPYGKVRLITGPHNSEKIDGISATALIFEAKSFFKLGGFDERFFAYLEDVDLFLRAKKQGFSFGVTKSATVSHEGQKTSAKFKVKKAWLDFKNWILVIGKNWSREELKKYWWSIFVERLRNLSGVIKAFF